MTATECQDTTGRSGASRDAARARLFGSRSWRLAVVLAVASCAVMLVASTLPQHGDGAIGTAVLMAAAAALFLALAPVVLVLLWRHGRAIASPRGGIAVAALLCAPPACLFLVLLATGQLRP